jgi:hypothetical protein
VKVTPGPENHYAFLGGSLSHPENGPDPLSLVRASKAGPASIVRGDGLPRGRVLIRPQGGGESAALPHLPQSLGP